MSEFTVIDLETTGLDPKRDKIIEIAAIYVKDGVAEKSFDTLVNPGRRIPKEVTELTGIQDEDVKEAPYIEEIIETFLAFVSSNIIMGHCVRFDFAFLKRAAVNAGYSFDKQAIDTLLIARSFLPDLKSRSLSNLCRHFQIAHVPHRALEDVKSTYLLYQKLEEMFRSEENENAFLPKQLVYKVKKEGPITAAQRNQLGKLLEIYHLTCEYNIDKMTKNEASRYIDQIIARHGRILTTS